jgi:hypothetical protein
LVFADPYLSYNAPCDVFGTPITVNGTIGWRITPLGVAADNDATQTNFRSVSPSVLPTGDQLTVIVVAQIDDATPAASMGFANSTTGNVDGFNMQLRTTPSVRFRTVQSSSGVNSDVTLSGVSDLDILMAVGTYDGSLTTAHYRDITNGASGDAAGSAESGDLSHDNFDIGRFSAGPGAGLDGGILGTFVWARAFSNADLDDFADVLFDAFRMHRRVLVPVAAAPSGIAVLRRRREAA